MAYIIKESEGPLTTYAQLYIGLPENNISPDDISDVLQLQPTDKRMKGDVVRRPRKTMVAPKSFWLLSTRKLICSENMETHLDYLLDIIMPIKDKILDLQKSAGVSMWIRCIWCSEDDDTGVNFTVEQIKQLAELNISCSFGLYFS